MKFQYIFPILFFISLLAACNLTQDVEIDLPEYDRQPVLECYLEPGQPYQLLLTRSYGFFAPFDTSDGQFLENVLEQGATVTINHDGKSITLTEGFFFNPFAFKIFNYGSAEIVPADFDNDFDLEIILANGETITGKTTIPVNVPIDSVVIEFQSDAATDTTARALTYFTDPDPSIENRFRRLFHWNSFIDSSAQQDFITTDQFAENGRIVFGTGFDYPVGDTIYNTVFNLNRDYSDFLESVQISIQSNGNPFGQPASIDSNLGGTADALGIFTGLSYDRVETIIKK